MAEIAQLMTIGLGVFMLIALGLAIVGWFKTDTMSDFAIAGEKLGPIFLGAAFAATFYSAATFVGYVGWSYSFGMTNLWTGLIFISASPLALILFSKRVREINLRQKSLSLPDWIGDFYNSDIVRVGMALAVLFNIFYVAAQLAAGAYIFEQFLGWNYNDGLIFITAFVTIYVFIGGTFADVYTDAVQAVLMAVMGSAIFISALWVFEPTGISSFTHVVRQITLQNPSYDNLWHAGSSLYYSPFAIFAAFFLAFSFAAQPQLFNKVLALNDPKNLRTMIMTFMTLSVLFLGVIWGGLYLLALDVGLSSPDQAIYTYVVEFFPPLFAVFLGLVILAAALATTDGIYVVLSTAVANDIFKKVLVKRDIVELDPERADRVSRYIAQATVIVVGVIAYYIVLNPPASVAVMVWVGIGGVASASVAPVLIGIYFPNFVTRKAAITAMIGGLVSYLMMTLWMDIRSVFVQGTLGVLVGGSIMVLVSALTAQEIGVARMSTEQRQQSMSDKAPTGTDD